MKNTNGLCPNGHGTSTAFFNTDHWNRVKKARSAAGLDRAELELSPGVKLVSMFDELHWQRVRAERIRQGLN